MTLQPTETVKAELVKMMELDQRYLNFKEGWHKLSKKHTKRLKEIITVYGFPTSELYGKEAAHAAWLITQHSPDLEFQVEFLINMDKLIRNNEVIDSDFFVNFAYLEDRILIKQGKKQLYGTQFKINPDGTRTPYPISYMEGLAKRRALHYLEPFEEYLKCMLNPSDSNA